MPFVPGLFEVYFTHNRDDPERMRRAAKALRELFYSGHPFELSAGGYPLYRVIPAADPIVKTIEINKSLGVERQVLPYEVLEEYLSKADLSDDMMVIREDLCIGCVVCASNFPNEAITLEKVRDMVPLKTQAEMEQKIMEKESTNPINMAHLKNGFQKTTIFPRSGSTRL